MSEVDIIGWGNKGDYECPESVPPFTAVLICNNSSCHETPSSFVS